MTPTSILPSLRASLPGPLDPVLWPASTEATTDDVRVRAVSMQRFAAVAGTPCVHTAEQAPPRYRLRDWVPRDVCVAVAAVTRVRRPWGVLLVELDAVLPGDVAVEDLVRSPCARAPTLREVATPGCQRRHSRADAVEPENRRGTRAGARFDVGSLVCHVPHGAGPLGATARSARPS